MKEKYNKKSFVTNLLIIMCAIIGTIIMYSNVDGGDLASGGIKNFKYYTVLSNEFCGLVALISLLLYQKYRDKLIMLKFVSLVLVCVTFMTVIVFLVHIYGFKDMYKGANLWFHLILPVVAFADFMVMKIEKEELPFKYTFFCMIPTAIYGSIYLLNILINGVGKWPNSNDWYGFVKWGLGVGILIFVVILFISWIMARIIRYIKISKA